MLVWFNVLKKIGFLNLLRFARYKIKLKLGIMKFYTPMYKLAKCDELVYRAANFNVIVNDAVQKAILDNAELFLNGSYNLFFNKKTYVGLDPDWFFYKEYESENHWTQVSINAVSGHDIKKAWDLSRFNWFVILLAAFRITNNDVYRIKANDVYNQWNEKNIVNMGVNWNCAQECSIRMINFLNALHVSTELIGFDVTAVEKFVFAHLQRISVSTEYSISQDNNHGLSEGAALFIGGSWLEFYSESKAIKKIAKKMSFKGRRILEERVSRLIFNDGGSSMYSSNYHRSFLNTFSIVEFWKTKLSFSDFSESYYSSVRKSLLWLHSVVDDVSGEAINLGANDGSNPFILQGSDYRDFRPCIQLSSVLFMNKKIYKNSAVVNECLDWMRIPHEDCDVLPIIKKSKDYPDSGLIILRSNDLNKELGDIFLKYPNYKFRPFQQDMFHLDFWVEGKNILRDAGSFSYNSDPDMMSYFQSQQAHNTVSVNNVDPMPKLGPFLYSSWSKVSSMSGLEFNKESISWQGSYIIKDDVLHTRRLSCSKGVWLIHDIVNFTNGGAVIRWRLSPDNWFLDGNTVYSERLKVGLMFKSNSNSNSNASFDIKIVTGFESRYYDSWSTCDVVEIRFASDKVDFLTEIFFR